MDSHKKGKNTIENIIKNWKTMDRFQRRQCRYLLCNKTVFTFTTLFLTAMYPWAGLQYEKAGRLIWDPWASAHPCNPSYVKVSAVG